MTPGAKINELIDQVERLKIENATQLADRDRLWCLALISALKIDGVSAVLAQFNNLKSRQSDALAQLDKLTH